MQRPARVVVLIGCALALRGERRDRAAQRWIAIPVITPLRTIRSSIGIVALGLLALGARFVLITTLGGARTLTWKLASV